MPGQLGPAPTGRRGTGAQHRITRSGLTRSVSPAQPLLLCCQEVFTECNKVTGSFGNKCIRRRDQKRDTNVSLCHSQRINGKLMLWGKTAETPKKLTRCVTRRNTEYTNYNYRLGTEQDKNQATVQMCKMNKLINYFTCWHKTKKVIARWSSTPKTWVWSDILKRQFLLIKLVWETVQKQQADICWIFTFAYLLTSHE